MTATFCYLLQQQLQPDCCLMSLLQHYNHHQQQREDHPFRVWQESDGKEDGDSELSVTLGNLPDWLQEMSCTCADLSVNESRCGTSRVGRAEQRLGWATRECLLVFSIFPAESTFQQVYELRPQFIWKSVEKEWKWPNWQCSCIKLFILFVLLRSGPCVIVFI